MENSVAQNMVELYRAHGKTCATAESCTGGLVGGAVTSVAGSSEVFLGGIISYANEVKMNVLGVPKGVLDTVGAVSRECAAAMAEGARRLTGADVAVSTTGIAGPGGGSAEKPVGLVWFGVASKTGTITDKKVFPGERESVRAAAIEISV